VPPLPVVSGDEALRAFERAGWVFTRQTASHMCMKKAGEWACLSIPRHKTLDRGTLRSLIREAGLTVEEFCQLLK
jgi:predicted RNA binding protein YcfA (HicA-like mRNA interferase family)